MWRSYFHNIFPFVKRSRELFIILSLVSCRANKIHPTWIFESVWFGKNQVWLQNFYSNLKFEQMFMSEFKSRTGSGLYIWIGVVRIFEQFRGWTIGVGYQTTRFICNFSSNSLENFIETTLDNWVRILKNRVWFWSQKNRSEYPKIIHKIWTFRQSGLDIWHSDLGLTKVCSL